MKKHVEIQTIKGELMQKYVVLQVTLKEKLIGTASKNLSELEDVINKQADKGYRLHTISTTSGGSKGLGGGDRITASRQQWCLKESNRWHLSLFVAWEQRLDAGA